MFPVGAIRTPPPSELSKRFAYNSPSTLRFSFDNGSRCTFLGTILRSEPFPHLVRHIPHQPGSASNVSPKRDALLYSLPLPLKLCDGFIQYLCTRRCFLPSYLVYCIDCERGAGRRRHQRAQPAEHADEPEIRAAEAV